MACLFFQDFYCGKFDGQKTSSSDFSVTSRKSACNEKGRYRLGSPSSRESSADGSFRRPAGWRKFFYDRSFQHCCVCSARPSSLRSAGPAKAQGGLLNLTSLDKRARRKAALDQHVWKTPLKAHGHTSRTRRLAREGAWPVDRAAG